MADQTTIPSNDTNKNYFTGNGEIVKLLNTMDWSQTSIGPIEQWPQSLLTSVSICLQSKFPIIIWWGQDLTVIYNDAYIQIFAGKHPNALGKPGLSPFAWGQEEIKVVIEPMLKGVLERGDSTWSEEQLLLLERKGFIEETYFTWSYSPIQEEGGKIGGVFAVVAEVSEQVLGKRRLKILRDLAEKTYEAKTLEECYNKISENLNQHPLDIPYFLLYSIDGIGEIAELKNQPNFDNNNASPRIIKIKEAQSEGWSIPKVIETGKEEVITNIIERFGKFPGTPWPESPHTAIVFPIIRPGQKIPSGILIVCISPRRELDINYHGFLKLLSDQIGTAIANVQALEEERKRAEALAEIAKAKTIFFSNVSHEFRTPLTLMLGPLEEVLNNDSSIKESSKEQLHTVHRNSLRLLKLVNTLLDFSRIEAGRIEATFRQTNICDLTSDLSSSFRSAIEKAGLKFKVKCSKITQPIYLDPTMWERIVFNLLSNAFKFTFKGEISVTVKQTGNNVELIIKDTGTGIPEKELPKLFSRFHRIENAQGRTHEGSGIGLAMVHELVKLHGGAIHVESYFGQGTTFTVSIPVGKEHLPLSQIKEPHTKINKTLNALPSIEEEISGFTSPDPLENSFDTIPQNNTITKEKILIADDNADMREYLIKLLENKYQIIAAKDGLEALEAAERESPALILSDVMMPVLDGFGLLKKLKAKDKTRSIPVIFLSARAGEEATIEGMEAGADDYLVKPFSAKELISRVNSNIKISRQRSDAEKNLRNLFDQAPVAIAILKEPSFFIELANEKVLEIWGKTYEEVINKPAFDVFPEIISQGFDKILNNVFNQGESFIAKEMGIDLVRNGKMETIYVNFVYDPLKDSEGKINGIVAVAVDVTDMVKARKLVEENAKELKGKNNLLTKINNDLDNFIYTASHDLRAPVSNIEGLVNTLRDSLLSENDLINEDTNIILQQIDQSISRFKTTILDLTEITKVQKGGEEDIKEIDLIQILEDVKLSIYDQITESGAAIKTDFSKVNIVRFSKKNLYSVMYNLLSNAIKYRDKNRVSEIQIKTEKTEEFIILTVKDNGLGMSKENLSRMFTMFKRFHDHVEGTGIGLYIVKRIIDNADGKIEVESEIGKGTTFKVFLRNINMK